MFVFSIGQRRPSRPDSPPGARLGDAGLHFPTHEAYHTWARVVDSEAPGLARRLLTIDTPGGGVEVTFTLAAAQQQLVPDGLDVLYDISRRLRLGVHRKPPRPKWRGGRPRPGSRPDDRFFPPVSTRRSSPCQLPA